MKELEQRRCICGTSQASSWRTIASGRGHQETVSAQWSPAPRRRRAAATRSSPDQAISKRALRRSTKGLPEGVHIENFTTSPIWLTAPPTRWQPTSLKAVLVIVVLLALLSEIHDALIVAAVIPFSMLFAFYRHARIWAGCQFDEPRHIDFRMVVDGSVVMVENMVSPAAVKVRDWRSCGALPTGCPPHFLRRADYFGNGVCTHHATFEGMEGFSFARWRLPLPPPFSAR